jgi:DNA-directed RNA polymerase specialized sigma24 family protein
MPSNPGSAPFLARRFSLYRERPLGALGCAVALAAGLLGAAQAEAQERQRPAAAVLLERLCANKLRPNEEDRLFGLLSITVRTTIKYEGGVFSPDLIDDAVQDGLGAITAACPQLAATDDFHRLGKAVELARDATLKRLRDAKAGYSVRQTEKATAADLSEELSAPEIDAWLDGLPARQRVLALLLYAAGLTQQEMADAVGLPVPALPSASHRVKTDLLRFFRADTDNAPPPPVAPGQAIRYREAGQGLAALLQPGAAPPATVHTPPTVRITGISSDVYAGWSLFATVRGLPADRSLEIGEPILVEPDRPGRRRMIVVAADEVSDSHDASRRFLLKAFAIDADKEGAGMHDSFHLGAATVDNAEARQTLRNPNLAAIEIARCLWHDYGTADDPGICR